MTEGRGEGIVAQELTASEEWRRGWKLVLACFAGFSFFSLMTASLGVFIAPLTKEFGWGRTLVSSGVTIASVSVGLMSPFIGILIDRHGSRKVAMPGLLAATAAISSFALVNGSPTQWLFLWVLYAVISVSVKTTVWTAALVRAFTKAQGLAMGVVLSGTAVAQVVAPPLATWLIEIVGWRMAYVWLACGWGAVTYFLCYFFLFDVDRRTPTVSGEVPQGKRILPGLTVREARGNTALWRIGICSFVIMLFTIGLLIHQIPILIEAGISATQAAWLASLAGAAGIAGKLVSGVLLDRYRANWVGGLTLASTALAFVLLVDGIHSPALIVLAMLINGYSAGSKLQIASYLTARYAGIRHFGVIYGVLISLVTFGSGLGPLVAGIIYDATGGYTPFLMTGAVACLFCGGLILSLPAYPQWRE